MMWARGLGSLLCTITWLSGCAEPTSQPERLGARLAAPVHVGISAPTRMGRPLRAMSNRTISSALVGATVGEERILIAADEDARALRVIRADDHALLATATMPGTPAQMVVGADGRLFVSLRDRARVLALRLDASGHGLVVDTTFDVPAEPIGLAVNGESLAIASAWDARVTVLSTRDGRVQASVPTPRDPRAVAFESDNKLVVTHGIGGHWSRIDIDAGTRETIDLSGHDVHLYESSSYKLDGPHHRSAREDCSRTGVRWDEALQGVACGSPMDDGQWVLRGANARAKIPTLRSRLAAFAAGAPGSFHTLREDLASLQLHQVHHFDRTAGQAMALVRVGTHLVAPAVLTRTNGGWWGDGYASHQPVLAHIREEEVTLRVESAAYAPEQGRVDAGRQVTLCTLPRAAATDGQVIFVACAGSDFVLGYDAEAKPLREAYRGALQVSSLPSGLAVDQERGMLHVWSQHAQTIASVPLDRFVPTASPHPHRAIAAAPIFAPTRTTALPPLLATELSEAARRGRLLFHTTTHARMSRSGIACASCHPDGRDDMLMWPTRFGRRQTPMLAGRLGADTKPYGWEGDSPTVHHHLGHTFARNGGNHLPEDQLHDLVAYLDEMPTPPPSTATIDHDLVERGRTLFFAPTVGCSSCHVEGTGTDGQRHDAGGGKSVDTPSLRSVGKSAPYFHDGRFSTLRELLIATQSQMGWAKEMTNEDITALTTFLETL